MADHDSMIAQLEGMKGKGKKAPAKKTGGKKESAKAVATGKGKVGVAGAPAAVQEAKEDVEEANAGGQGNGPEECPTCGHHNPAGTIEHRLANLKAKAEIAQALAEEARKAAEAIEASNAAVRANRDKVLGEWSKGIQEKGEKNREAYRNYVPPKKAEPKNAEQEITKHYPPVPQSKGSPWEIYIKFLRDIQNDDDVATHTKSSFGYDRNTGHKWSSKVSYPIVAYDDNPHANFEREFSTITYDGKESDDRYFQVKIICGWEMPYVSQAGNPLEKAGPHPLTPIWLLISCRDDRLKNMSSAEALTYCLQIIEREKGKKTINFGEHVKHMRWGEQYKEACLAVGNFEAHYAAQTGCFTRVEDDYQKEGPVDWVVNDYYTKNPWKHWESVQGHMGGDRRTSVLRWLTHKGISTKGVRKDYDTEKIINKYVDKLSSVLPDPTSNEDDKVFAQISGSQSIEDRMKYIRDKLSKEGAMGGDADSDGSSGGESSEDEAPKAKAEKPKRVMTEAQKANLAAGRAKAKAAKEAVMVKEKQDADEKAKAKQAQEDEMRRIQESHKKGMEEALVIPKEALQRALKMSKQNAGIRRENHKETHSKYYFIKELYNDSRVQPNYQKNFKLQKMFDYLPDEFKESDLK